jgi:flagellin-specific chaperone FliS
MTKEDIEAIIEKYRKMSENERSYGEEKCLLFEYIADQIQVHTYDFIDNENYESEEDVIDTIKVILDSQDGILDDEDYENIYD